MMVSIENVQQSPNTVGRNESRPPHPPKKYLWVPVNLKDPKLQNEASFGRTQSFLKSEGHRLRKAKQLEKLRASIRSLPAQSSKLYATDQEREFNDTRQSKSDQAGLVVQVDQAFGIGVQVAFPSFSIPTSTSLDFYLKYSSKDLPALMLVLLASAASSRAASLLPRSDSVMEVKQLMQDSLKMRAQAIKSLQVEFNGGLGSDKEALLLTVALLLGLEAAEGNLKAAMAHANGLKMMVAMLEQLEDTGAVSHWHDIHSLMHFADVMLGMISDSPALFYATPEWERRAIANFTPPMMDEYLTGPPSILGMAFFTSPWTDTIPAELKDIIQSLQKLIPHHERSLRLGNLSSIIENDFLIMLARQLLIVPLNIRLDPFQETIRFSIFIYFVTRLWSFETFLFFPRKGDVARDIWVKAQSIERNSILTGGGKFYPGL
ncbi:uncharacterized protein N7483_003629 [Penicillium malachiteum]|uniref:uncharacterized protein n=1 Tax=Penicillium malachiteum TaxID=1324776 RepID=UPI00254900E5|nr:uncharacterized protein N7483_003629 [Penicillium malachiteum]KAJ5729121.1 hypothetical protein N7483_003629 [Penicillium malachiteum]